MRRGSFELLGRARKTLAGWAIAALFVAALGFGSAQTVHPKPGPSTIHNPLNSFAGEWESQGEMHTTPYTHAGVLHGRTTCHWMAEQTYLACEQIYQQHGELHHQLTVYTDDPKTGAFDFYTFAEPGTLPYSGRVSLDGNVWTYGDRNPQPGKYPQFRTTNIFTSTGRYTFRAEFTDDGSHWTVMSEGVVTRQTVSSRH